VGHLDSQVDVLLLISGLHGVGREQDEPKTDLEGSLNRQKGERMDTEEKATCHVPTSVNGEICLGLHIRTTQIT
jgi:hypothetical protein